MSVGERSTEYGFPCSGHLTVLPIFLTSDVNGVARLTATKGTKLEREFSVITQMGNDTYGSCIAKRGAKWPGGSPVRLDAGHEDANVA